MVPEQPTEDSALSRAERGLAEQIFVVSAAMVGVCLTLMGLVSLISSLNQVATFAEELLAADAILFLVACLSSYLSLRSGTGGRAHRYERLADGTFIIAMLATVGLGAVIALRLF